MAKSEEWRDIAGYEGLYQVSDAGRVKSLARGVAFCAYDRCAEGYVRSYPSRVLRGSPRNGYVRVVLIKNKKRSAHSVHRLVGEAFIPNPGRRPHINHKNSVRNDNAALNLEWATRSENMKHAWAAGRCEATRVAARENVKRANFK